MCRLINTLALTSGNTEVDEGIINHEYLIIYLIYRIATEFIKISDNFDKVY